MKIVHRLASKQEVNDLMCIMTNDWVQCDMPQHPSMGIQSRLQYFEQHHLIVVIAADNFTDFFGDQFNEQNI